MDKLPSKGLHMLLRATQMRKPSPRRARNTVTWALTQKINPIGLTALTLAKECVVFHGRTLDAA